MRTRSTARWDTPYSIATLLIVAAALVVGGRSVVPTASAAPRASFGGSARVGAPVELSDVAAAVATPSLHAFRVVENRIAPVWALPGLAASIVAFGVCRRRRTDRQRFAGRARLRGSVASRAPPLASIA